jgi:hypothetical protein
MARKNLSNTLIKTIFDVQQYKMGQVIYRLAKTVHGYGLWKRFTTGGWSISSNTLQQASIVLQRQGHERTHDASFFVMKRPRGSGC